MKVSLNDFFDQEPLIIADIKALDGTMHEWTFGPPDEATELQFIDWQAKQEDTAEARKTEMTLGHTPKVPLKGEIWAELVALALTVPKLDETELRKEFPGRTLMRVGRAVQSFFLTGAWPEELLKAGAQKSQASTT